MGAIELSHGREPAGVSFPSIGRTEVMPIMCGSSAFGAAISDQTIRPRPASTVPVIGRRDG